jgi:hypothetical protein
MFGIYSTHAALESAVEALRAKGFRNSDVSILSGQKPASADAAPVDHPRPEVAAGPSTSATIGATLGWLAGISALAVAGSVFIVAGPVMWALAQMGETTGDIAGALVGFGLPDTAAKQYQGRIVSGGMLLAVHTDDLNWFRDGKQILEQTGAESITTVLEPGTRVVMEEAQGLVHPMV